MSSSTATLPTATNRRRRVRHKIQTPAYASFSDDPSRAVLDLHEIVDISEDGMAIQCHSPLTADTKIQLCLDLADCPQNIYTSGQVIWANDSGRAGLRFSDLPADCLARLREWLFVNVMAGVANGEAEVAVVRSRETAPSRPSYTDTLAAINAVQRQVDSLGTDLDAALRLIAQRAQSFVRASGCAIALAGPDPDFMICRASSGEHAPPVDSQLQVGSGFSGECVRTGALLRCDDTELDSRVDRESCSALGIRAILAAPVRSENKSVGLIEAFSPDPNAFSDVDGKVFQKLADIIATALSRSAKAPATPAPSGFTSPQGSVLFAAADKAEESSDKDKNKDEHETSQSPQPKDGPIISLPRSHIAILVCAAGIIFLVLGYLSAPLIQASVAPWLSAKLHARGRVQLQTVLASTSPDGARVSMPAPVSVETASLDQLRQMAEKGLPAAQYALGLRYAQGEGLRLDEGEAARWFLKAAEQGHVLAQSKLGSFYYGGRGVPQDTTRAYFWMVVARLAGDEWSKIQSPFVRARLTRAQVTSIELEADRWLQQHSADKPAAGQLKARN